jgi:hypothetical protein
MSSQGLIKVTPAGGDPGLGGGHGEPGSGGVTGQINRAVGTGTDKHGLQKGDRLFCVVLGGQAIDRYLYCPPGRVGDIGDEFPMLAVDFVDVAAAVHVDGTARPGCWAALGGDRIDGEIVDD